MRERIQEIDAAAVAEKRRKEALCAFVQECFEERKEMRKSFDGKWQLALSFLNGNQNVRVTELGDLVEDEEGYEWQEKQTYNHIAPILEARLAKLARVQPTVSVRAEGPEESDLQVAKLSSKIVKSCFESLKLKDLVLQATLWSETCGSVFYKITWNGAAGRVVGGTEAHPIFEGEAEVSVCPPFEVYPEDLSAMNLSEVRSLIHAKAMHVDEIAERWGVTVDPEPVRVFSGESVKNPRLTEKEKSDRYAMVLEYYERPTKTYPQGRLLTVCGKELLYEGALPYTNEKRNMRGFPFVLQNSLNNAGSLFGSCVVERCIPIQRAYNAVKNRKLELMNRISGGVLAVEDGSVDVEALSDEGLAPGKILVYRQGSRAPSYLDAGSIPPEYNREEDRLLNEFVLISGVSEVMRTSIANAQATSGIALQLMIEQDDTRLSVSAENIRSAVREIGTKLLRLYKQFAGSTRLMKLSGGDGEVEVFYFGAADISADEVVMDTENELTETPAQKKAMILDLYKLGIFADEQGKVSERVKARVLSLLGYGSIEGGQDITALQMSRAQKESLKSLSEEIAVSEIDDHEVHIREHSAFMLSGEYECADDRARERLNQHVQAHKAALSLADGV